MASPAAEYLSEKKIPHSEFVHEGKVASIAQAAAERDQDVDQVVRSLLFRIKAGEYVMVLATGTRKISWKRMRAYYSQSRISMPGPDEVVEVTGYEVGTVNPFRLKTPIPILVDQSVRKRKEISIGSGVRGTGIVMKVGDLLRALENPTIVQFTEK